MRRTRVDRSRAHHSCVVLEIVEARVCDATEARVSVAVRVRSYSCPRHIDCNHFYQSCAWVDRNEVQSFLFIKHCASHRRSMDEVLSGSV